MVYTGYQANPPTACPHNNTHTIDPTGIINAGGIPANPVSITQGGLNTYLFKTKGYNVSIPAGAGVTTPITLTNPYAVNSRLFTFYPITDNIGDSFSILANPNTPVGLTTADTPIGSTTVTVGPSVMIRVVAGYMISLSTGGVIYPCGEIASYNKTASTITFSTPTTVDIPIGSTVMFTGEYAANIPIVSTEKIQLGLNNFATQENTAASTSYLYYTNASGAAKMAAFVVEFRYGNFPGT